MEIRAVDTPLLDWTGDAIALGLFEDTVEQSDDLTQLDAKFAGRGQLRLLAQKTQLNLLVLD